MATVITPTGMMIIGMMGAMVAMATMAMMIRMMIV